MKRSLKDIAWDSWSRMKIRWPALSYGALPLIVFSGFLIVSLLAYTYTYTNLTASRKLATEEQFANNDEWITTEMDTYANILRGSAAEMQNQNITEGK